MNKWDKHFYNICLEAASMTTCLRRGVGCVIIKDRHILSTGFNGPPSGVAHCTTCKREGLPSGDKLDLCLHGDTIIKLLDGGYKTIADLAKLGTMEFWVYACDTTTGKIVPALASNAHKTGIRDDLVLVTLDNSSVLRCTYDHLVLLRNGEYKEAGSLVPGESLMPMYYNFAANNGYESISNTVKSRVEGHTTNWKTMYVGRTLSEQTHHLVYEHFYGERIPNTNIHHKDCTKINNCPDNLQVTTAKEHRKYHPSTTTYAHDIECYNKGLRAYHERMRDTPEYKDNKSKLGSKNMSANWANTKFRLKMKATGIEKGKATAAKTNSDLIMIKRRQQGIIISGILNLARLSGEIITLENYNSLKSKYPVRAKLKEKGSKAYTLSSIAKWFDTIEEPFNIARTNNHKVVEVIPLEGTHDVYDVSVPIYNNIAVDLSDNSCIFVHNCMAAHSEQNAISQAARHGVSLNGSDMYVTTKPCSGCLKSIIGAGIHTVHYAEDYPSSTVDEMARQAGVQLIQLK